MLRVCNGLIAHCTIKTNYYLSHRTQRENLFPSHRGAEGIETAFTSYAIRITINYDQKF